MELKMTDVVVDLPAKYENTGFDESWTEIYDDNPYVKDENQVSKDNIEAKHGESEIRIIDADSSPDEAMKAVESVVPVEDVLVSVYQCKHCGVLFDHPKRFLIHHKWHSFGRFNELKRLKALARRRERPRRKPPKADEETADDGNPDHKCNICWQTYNSKGSLKNHRARVHFANPKECPVCKKVFQNNTYLKSHMTTHTEEKNFTCDECPKSFKFLHSLLRHQPTHKDKTFSCGTCDKSFGSELLLKIHKKTHERTLKGPTYQCSYCAKGFYHAYSLHVHERTHRGERPFTCSICNSSYSTNSSLQRHLKVSHSGVKPYECSVCKRSFLTETIRDRHTSRQHQQVDDVQIATTAVAPAAADSKPKRLRKASSVTQIKKKKLKKASETTESEEVGEENGINLTAYAFQAPEQVEATSSHMSVRNLAQFQQHHMAALHEAHGSLQPHMFHSALQQRLQSLHRRMSPAMQPDALPQ